MFRNRRSRTLLPLLVAVLATIVVNAIPAIRAFALQEPGFVTADWACYFVTVPAAIIQLIVGGLASAVLAFIKDERTHAYIAYAMAGLLGLSLVPLLIFVCQPA